MKKSILLLSAVLITFSLTALGFINYGYSTFKKDITQCGKPPVEASAENVELKKPLDLVYKVDNRFVWNVTKAELENAKSVIDILPSKATNKILNYKSVGISMMNGDKRSLHNEIGYSPVLTEKQIQTLKSFEYSQNFLVLTDYEGRNPETDQIEERNSSYAFTLVPEEEASFKDGQHALIEYLKESTKGVVGIIEKNRLQPGRVYFTVTSNGRVSNVWLGASCGYPSIDEALIEVCKNIPEKWEPANNYDGVKVDQELVFFFGLQGC